MSRNNSFISLQKGFLSLMVAALLFSCSNVETFDASDIDVSNERLAVVYKSQGIENARLSKEVCGDQVTLPLVAGNGKYEIGEVSAYNDRDSLYVTISIEGDYADDWFIRKSHLYFGKVQEDFTQKVGKKNEIINPAPGKFPHSHDVGSENKTGLQVYTYSFKIGTVELNFGELDIAVHADVVRLEDISRDENGVAIDGKIVQSEGAWVGGESAIPFSNKGNWSKYFNFSFADCDVFCVDKWYSSRRVTAHDELEEITTEYQVSSGNIPVGKVTMKRTGNKNHTDVYTYTLNFIPLDDYSFDEVSAYVQADPIAEIDRTLFAENLMSEKVNGKWEIIFKNAPYVQVSGQGNNVASSLGFYVKVADVCP